MRKLDFFLDEKSEIFDFGVLTHYEFWIFLLRILDFFLETQNFKTCPD